MSPPERIMPALERYCERITRLCGWESVEQAHPGGTATPTVLDRRLPSKLDGISLIEGAVSSGFDVGEVNPHIRGRVTRLDAAPSLLGLEELHSATAHIVY